MKKLIIILAIVVITGGFTIGYYMYNKPHVNVSKKKIDFTTIIIKGDQSLANCEMDTLYTNKIPSFTAEEEISVKGLFVGYDDLLGELQLKKCLIVKQ